VRVVPREDGGELARVRLSLRLRGGELLLEALELAALHVDVGREDERLGGPVELDPAAVPDGHAREPGALGFEGGGFVAAESDGDGDVVALAADGDVRRAARARGRAALSDEDLEDAAQLGLVAEDGGAFAHLDLDARFGRDLPDEGGEVDLAAAPSGHGAPVEGGERGDGLVEAVQRALDAAAAFIGVRLMG
jgi:hypothetical protein